MKAKSEQMRVDIRRQNTKKIMDGKRLVRLLRNEQKIRDEQPTRGFNLESELQIISNAYEVQDL
jgi:hypothetical protein